MNFDEYKQKIVDDIVNRLTKNGGNLFRCGVPFENDQRFPEVMDELYREGYFLNMSENRNGMYIIRRGSQLTRLIEFRAEKNKTTIGFHYPSFPPKDGED